METHNRGKPLNSNAWLSGFILRDYVYPNASQVCWRIEKRQTKWRLTHLPPFPIPSFSKPQYSMSLNVLIQFFLTFLIIQIRYARVPDRKSSNMSSAWSFSIWRVVAVFSPPRRQSSLLAHRGDTPNQMTTHTPPSILNFQFLKAAIRYDVSQRPYSVLL